MHLFHKRPLLLALLCFVAVTALLAFLTPSARLGFLCLSSILSIVFAVVWIILKIKGGKHVYFFFCLFLCTFFIAIASTSSHGFFDARLRPLEEQRSPVMVVAEVRECTFRASYTESYVVQIKELDGKKTKFKALLSIADAVGLYPGNLITANISFSPFEKARNGYDKRANNIADGILIAGTINTFEILAEESGTVWTKFEALRNSISDRIDNGKATESAPMLKALLLGDRSELKDGTSLQYRRLGISHILSISGTHFTTLLGLALFLLSALRCNKRLSYALLIPLALFYMGLTGFLPSVCRAGIMAMLAYIGLLSGRMRDSYTALFVSVALILLLQPYTVFSVGLWLSFSATFAILVLIDLFNLLEKAARATVWKKLLFIAFSRIVITVFVSFITLPIISVVFGEISLLSVVGNLLIVPLFELFLYLVPFSVLFPNFSFFTSASDLLYVFISNITASLSSTDGIMVTLRPSFVPYIAMVGIFTTLLLLALPLKKRGWILLPGSISLIALLVYVSVFLHIHAAQTDITYFTYKESDGIVITDQNRSLLIDISNASSTPAYNGRYIAQQNYSTELDGILFTHYHKAHAATLQKLAASVHIRSVYLPKTENNEAQISMLAIEEIAKQSGIKVQYITYDAPFSFAGCEITVFAPEYLSRSTHPTVSLSINVKNRDVLYLGSSFNEGAHDFSKATETAEYIIYGQHHPKVKKPFSVSSEAFAIFGSKEQLSFSEKKRAVSVFDGEEGEYTITLK